MVQILYPPVILAGIELLTHLMLDGGKEFGTIITGAVTAIGGQGDSILVNKQIECRFFWILRI